MALAQSIRNERANLESLELNLLEHEALSAAGLVAPIQVDQVYQEYEQGRLNLLSANQGLDTALDGFKLQLGLPPQLDVRLDSAVLVPYELNDSAFTDLEKRNEQLRLELLQFDEDNLPPAERISPWYQRLTSQLDELPAVVQQIASELNTLMDQLQTERQRQTDATETDQVDLDRRLELADRLKALLDETSKNLTTDRQRVGRQIDNLDATAAKESWELIGGLLGVVLGLVTPNIVSWISGRTTIITLWAPVVALLVALSVGIGFGVYPARRAALLDPIEALRAE